MYSIDSLCPNGGMGGHGFMIYLSPEFREAVKSTNITQEQVDRVIKTYGQEWLQKVGFSHYFDPENCGYGADAHAIPSAETRPSPGWREIRVSWGEWGPEHISVPGNACGLDLYKALGNPFEGGMSLAPHNVDCWQQVCLLLVVFTWFAHYVILHYRNRSDE